MNDLPAVLAEDINSIGRIVRKEMGFKQGLFLNQAGLPENPALLSSLLLASASFGKYVYSKLEPVAVGLELLNFGVRQHFPMALRFEEMGDGIDHLALIGGDYFYSRGISIAAQTGMSMVVEGLSEAIVRNIEAEALAETSFAIDEWNGIWGGHAALHGRACELGASVGRVEVDIASKLKEFGQVIGRICRLLDESKAGRLGCAGHGDRLIAWVKEAGRIAGELPENECKTHLVHLPGSLSKS